MLWVSLIKQVILTVFLWLSADQMAVFVQPLLEQVVLDVQLLLSGHVHGINAQI